MAEKNQGIKAGKSFVIPKKKKQTEFKIEKPVKVTNSKSGVVAAPTVNEQGKVVTSMGGRPSSTSGNDIKRTMELQGFIFQEEE